MLIILYNNMQRYKIFEANAIVLIKKCKKSMIYSMRMR